MASFSFYDPAIGYNSSNPFNSAFAILLNTVSSYDSIGWSGLFEPDEFILVFEATGTSMSDNEINPFGGPPYSQSASGTWTTITPLAPTGSIPDAAGTLWLLLGGLAVLGGVRFWNRSQVI